MFYSIFAVFMLLVVLFTLAAAAEYGAAAAAGQRAAIGYLIGAVVLSALAVWWLVDAARGGSPTTLPQAIRAAVFLLAAGPILSPPAFAHLRGAIHRLGRFRRIFWRPASLVGLVMIVLWFLS